MPSNIPDRIEPVVAYRYWSMNSGINMGEEHGILYSLGWSPFPWKPEEPQEAYHIKLESILGAYFPSHTIDSCPGARSTGHKCGFYGIKEKWYCDSIQQRSNEIISGQVYLWGLIVEHESGYRAQFAYPKCLYLDRKKDDEIRMVASNYKIPAIEPPDSRKLLEELDRMAIAIMTGVPNATSRDTGV